MESVNSLFQKDHIGQLVLIILFIIYLIIGYKTPEPLANMVDSLIGKIVLFIIVIYLFIYTNPLLAVLGLFVSFDLIRLSSMTTGIDALQRFAPSEDKKISHFTAYNQFPYTLEQEIVTKMAPIMQSGTSITKASYRPCLLYTSDAADE